ncbi:hypothetical protein ACIGEZ_31690 [Streptomyces sp. NPDC085481]|uniref:hypothetical protein n=1 Tax=Streptomyces sp. NPDC085481 TaxID=3365727 RepID=UPI0037D4F2A5
MSRTLRALAAFAALAGLVLGLVVCGAVTDTPTGKVAVAMGGPGCDQGHGDDGAAGPVVPPRSHGFGELLPALAADRAPCGVWGVDEDVKDLAPGREPPALAAPSTVELSILRV